MKTKCPK